jgi:hypothetical protein
MTSSDIPDILSYLGDGFVLREDVPIHVSQVEESCTKVCQAAGMFVYQFSDSVSSGSMYKKTSSFATQRAFFSFSAGTARSVYGNEGKGRKSLL